MLQTIESLKEKMLKRKMERENSVENNQKELINSNKVKYLKN